MTIFQDVEKVYHLEIGPLKEKHYTGIPQVTAAIAQQMLDDTSRRCEFFYGRVGVEREVVEDLLTRRNGELLEWHLQRSGTKPAPPTLPGCHIAIFPNRKTCRYSFTMECQIVHDLSTFLTRQFHSPDTIDFHTTSMYDDVRSNDLTICVSAATREDVLRYLGPVDPARVIAVPLAADTIVEEVPGFGGRCPEPYILVLGTIEPRKNIGIVLKYLGQNRALLKRTKFVFLGRYGWGDKFEALLSRYDLRSEWEAGRIIAPGFVAESTKNVLLRHAQVLIYPSLFEGFGLPLLEGLSFGVPVVTTRSSSLPEVGGEACYYFSPFQEGDFGRAMSRAIIDRTIHGDRLRKQCRARAADFSWAHSYRTIMTAIDHAFPVSGGG